MAKSYIGMLFYFFTITLCFTLSTTSPIYKSNNYTDLKRWYSVPDDGPAVTPWPVSEEGDGITPRLQPVLYC